MRRLLLGLALALAVAFPAQAQKTKSAIISEIVSTMPDNTAGTITPQANRNVLIDIVQSYLDIGTVLSIPPYYVRPRDYGAACNGVTNDAVALQNMLTASAGKTIFIEAGTCVTNSTLTIPSNTTITGAGREVSILKSTANPALSGINVSNISLTSFQILGTDSAVSWASSPVGPISIIQNGSQATTASNFTIRDMKFAGFNVSYWVLFSAGLSTVPVSMTNITIENNYLLTTSADIPTDVTPSNNSNFGFVIFSGVAGNGRIENTVIRGNRIYSSAMCFPLSLFSNHFKAKIEGNFILSPGTTTPAHCVNGFGNANNSYGILVYDGNGDGNPPTNIDIGFNFIYAPTSAGIYMVGDGTVGHVTAVYNSSNSKVFGNFIVSQSGTDDNILPRAAISISLLTDISVIGNTITLSFGGIAAVGQMTGVVQIEGNTCINGIVVSVQTPYCVKLVAGNNGSSNTDKRIVRGNYLEQIATGATGGYGIKMGSATGVRFNEVEISDNTINAGWVGVDAGAQFFTGSFVIKGNKFGGVMTDFMLSVASLTGLPVSVMDNVFDSSGGVAGNALIATSSVLHMVGNKFINRASGSVPMFTAIGACGTILGTQFNSVVQAAQVAATSLGTANPSGCTLNYLDQVQNLTPAEAGAGGSKYVVSHWAHIATAASTAHLEQRMLTGN